MATWGRRGVRTVITVAVATLICLQPDAITPSTGEPASAVELPAAEPTQTTTKQSAAASRRPNIVLIQLDDFSDDLTQTLRSARTMRKQGASFRHSFVVDSLCCVSRASTFTGQYPHQTGVRTNTDNLPNPVGPVGGWAAFRDYGNSARQVALRLQRAGYRTGYTGKFLNQYEIRNGQVPPAVPGWSEFNVLLGSAYDGWGFVSTRRVAGGGITFDTHPAPPATASAAEKDRAYAGTAIADFALSFVRRHERDAAPYFLQVAPYAPHNRVSPQGAYPGDPLFPPAFRDRPGPTRLLGNCGRISCAKLTVADLPGWGDRGADLRPRRTNGGLAPAWNPQNRTLSRGTATRDLRNRARMAQSADRMIRRILNRVGPHTYVILTSDNGLHLGQFGLARGKGTPYDVDVRVPLLVVGPDVEPGRRKELVTNIDLAPTMERLAGLRPAAYRSGRSFVAALKNPTRRRNGYAFFEHTYAPSLAEDPDVPFAGGTMDLIPSYVAVRTRDQLLVRLDLDPSWTGTDYAWEFYDYSRRGIRAPQPLRGQEVCRRRSAAAGQAEAVRSVWRGARQRPGAEGVSSAAPQLTCRSSTGPGGAPAADR